MNVIAFMNLKGGTAKTTTTVNTAAILARDYGQRVLVVDADSQGNTTEFLGLGVEHPGLADLLRGGEAMIQATALADVDLLAADDTLMDLDLSKAAAGEAKLDCLLQLRKSEDVAGRYDAMLIDCPPAFNAAAAAALLAADEVVIPMKLDAFSLRGMANLIRQIRNMQLINPTLRVAGILPTMWYNSEEIQKAERQLRLSALPVFPHIRRSAKVDDMTFRQQPLIYSSPKSGACQDYKRFVRRLMEGGARNG